MLVELVQNNNSEFRWSKNKTSKWPLVSAPINLFDCVNSMDVCEVKST